jgi:hypothetical protein
VRNRTRSRVSANYSLRKAAMRLTSMPDARGRTTPPASRKPAGAPPLRMLSDPWADADEEAAHDLRRGQRQHDARSKTSANYHHSLARNQPANAARLARPSANNQSRKDLSRGEGLLLSELSSRQRTLAQGCSCLVCLIRPSSAFLATAEILAMLLPSLSFQSAFLDR